MCNLFPLASIASSSSLPALPPHPRQPLPSPSHERVHHTRVLDGLLQRACTSHPALAVEVGLHLRVVDGSVVDCRVHLAQDRRLQFRFSGGKSRDEPFALHPRRIEHARTPGALSAESVGCAFELLDVGALGSRV